MELQKERPMELQKERPLELQRVRPTELQKERPMELQRERPMELQLERPMELLKDFVLGMLNQVHNPRIDPSRLYPGEGKIQVGIQNWMQAFLQDFGSGWQ
jgi:hypothetical protein